MVHHDDAHDLNNDPPLPRDAHTRDELVPHSPEPTLHQKRSNTGVPNLGYMYPQGYICLSEGVHLRLSIEEQNIFAHDIFPNICAYINEYSFQKSLYPYC